MSLSLVDLASGEERTFEDIEMTAAKRRMVWQRANEPRQGPVSRVERKRSTTVPEPYRFLSEFIASSDEEQPAWLPVADAHADLAQLEWMLENEYSYLTLTGVDYRAAIDAVAVGLADSEHIERSSFAIQLMKLLALFGDGHTRLTESASATFPRGYAPYLLAWAQGGLVAFRSDRSGFVDEDHPFLIAIDGVPIETWLQAAERVVAQGSEHFRRRQATGMLRYIQYLRRELGKDESGELGLTLVGADGARMEVTVAVSDDRPTYGPWPRARRHERLEGDIGYLRIPQMTSEPRVLEELHETMEKYRDTRGLIIDVRGNGGGSRDILAQLLPYFLSPKEGPRVVNVATYRLRQGDKPSRPEGFLDNRRLFPAAFGGWDEGERATIRTLQSSFQPEWTPPAASFSDWHYFLLAGTSAPYHYDRPVIVLLDSGCYSATDIFLGAFSGLDRVTLMGSASGGGSGRSQSRQLEKSAIGLRLSSMASFRTNGALYDGRGVEPDVVVEVSPDDLIGRSDTVLDRAIETLAR